MNQPPPPALDEATAVIPELVLDPLMQVESACCCGVQMFGQFKLLPFIVSHLHVLALACCSPQLMSSSSFDPHCGAIA